MKAKQWVQLFLIALAFGFGSSSAQNVKITPLGSHAGELCDRDRATISRIRPASGYSTMPAIR